MADIISASQGAAEALVGQYCSLAPFVMLYYDYFLTLPMEIERFWPQRTFSWALFFFYLNRYLALLGQIPFILWNFLPQLSKAPHTCLHLQKYHQYFVIVAQIVVGVLLIMRVYALYSRSRTVLALLCIAAGAVIIFGCWSVMTAKEDYYPIQSPVPYLGCSNSLTRSQAIHLASVWSCLFVFDTLVFVMTVAKAILVGRSGDRTLIKLLLRDGSTYFLVLCLANLLNILGLVFGGPFFRGVGGTFTNALSVVMMSRLMLNLRSPSLIQGKASMDTDSDFCSSIHDRVSTVAYPLPCDTFVGLEPSQGGYLGRDNDGISDMALVSRMV